MKIDFSQLQQAIEEIIPFNIVLGLKVLTLQEGIAKIIMPYNSQLLGDVTRPALHGGAIAAMIDAAGGAALYTLVKPADKISTIDMRVDYLRPAPKDNVIAVAEVRRAGNRVAVVNVIVTPEKSPEPVAEGKCVYSVKRVKETE